MENENENENENRADWRAAAASWIADDDVETFFLSEPDPLGFGAFFAGVGAWAANRRERARAAAAAAATPPPLQVVTLSDADRERLGLGCDEMHFLPVPDSGWSVALLRYKPRGYEMPFPSFSTPCVTSPDAMWDDSDFARGAGAARRAKLPAVLVPGCASNAYTFDVAPSASLARALAGEGHDVFIVECRGVGFSRPWRSPSEWADKETNTPRQHAPTFGDFDYDTYCRCCRSTGNLRPHVVWFGEMPLQMNRINSALENCDMFVAIGTSGNVYPASGFYQTAKIRQACTVELNLERTGSSFDQHVSGPATECVPQFFESLLRT